MSERTYFYFHSICEYALRTKLKKKSKLNTNIVNYYISNIKIIGSISVMANFTNSKLRPMYFKCTLKMLFKRWGDNRKDKRMFND